ncbi:uncharacterized protein [Mycetomoellerius zeteki]|uniref:uncharacterized protein n=1 Tax=Mycetomoellerius zeteki TaxID=64791 RepID=UPI00084E81B9|nr:PREDICTED: uncharacterized protein LOC108726717 [Trachymyrmex zeteki]
MSSTATVVPVPSASGPTTDNSGASQTNQQFGASHTCSRIAQSCIIKCTPVLLATALVTAISPAGERFQLRALLDQGSEVSFISESAAQLLKLSRKPASVPILGIGAQRSDVSNGRVSLEIISRINSAFSIKLEALVLPKLTAYLPLTKISSTHWPHIDGLRLADPNFSMPGKIDLILGASVYAQILESGIRRGNGESPIAQKIVLGWILSGQLSNHNDHLSQDAITDFSVLSIVNFLIYSNDFGNKKKSCRRLMLPAHRKKLSVNFTLKRLTLVTLTGGFLDSSRREFFLPHHDVIKDSSSTTKLRVVFNGSQKTNLGISLNDCLHIGPKLQTELTDIIIRADTVATAKEKIQQLQDTLTAGGVNLKKWVANSPDLLVNISAHNQEVSAILPVGDPATHYALGVQWNRLSDSFMFSAPSPPRTFAITKRSVLSFIARIFDPLGWLAPIIISAKIFMQELWAIRLDWDCELPDDLKSHWIDFLAQFKNFDIHVTLVSAKTKVTPLKRVTIPRLELSVAVLLVKLIVPLISGPILLSRWPGSRAIHQDGRNSCNIGYRSYKNCQTLVGITSLGKKIPPTWHREESLRNDYSRSGSGGRDLNGSNEPPLSVLQRLERIYVLARRGEFSGCNKWPASTCTLSPVAQGEERARSYAVAIVSPEPEAWDLIKRYSSLTKLLRITAWIRRAIERFRKATDAHAAQDPLTPLELDSALAFWIKLTQHACFSLEIQLIKANKPLPKSSPLLCLIPFIDTDELLHLRGRLQHSQLARTEKHPLILLRSSRLTELIIDHYHRKTFHGGPQLTLASIRRQFWILGGRLPIRSFIRRCLVCTRQRAATGQQLMGQLPASRVTPCRPFYHTGVDYAGPLTLKTFRGRGAKTYKGYFIIFTCFSTSAIHLEVATDYSTEGFIAAYKRFTSRRGLCSTITSDCGTNLAGADAEL